MFSEEFLSSEWGYLGIALWIIATGLPIFPCPEEVPVILAGAMVGHPGSGLNMWGMLASCILAVVIGDCCLYGLGRVFGPRLVEFGWVKKYVLPPERLARIERNFHEYGIKILLFARLTPGIRAPIFVAAGVSRLPLIKFMIADGIYAIPGVTLLFFLGYWFTDQLNSAVAVGDEVDRIKPILIAAAILILGIYLIYRFWRRPNVTGDPAEMPPLVGQVTSKIMYRTHDTHVQPAQAKPQLPEGTPPPAASENGEVPPPADHQPALAEKRDPDPERSPP